MNILAVGAHPDNFKPHGAGTPALHAPTGRKVLFDFATCGDTGSPACPRDRIGMAPGRKQIGVTHAIGMNTAIRRQRVDFDLVAGVTR